MLTKLQVYLRARELDHRSFERYTIKREAFSSLAHITEVVKALQIWEYFSRCRCSFYRWAQQATVIWRYNQRMQNILS
jgi:hypothetical protein